MNARRQEECRHLNHKILLMKGHPQVPAVVQCRDGVGPVAVEEAKAVEVLMLLVMPLVAGHQFGLENGGRPRHCQPSPTQIHPQA
ncbi:hypothetical protein VZT92_014583 [Zoarces viviparus]|uniref:Uncharacterized protein n=1 Tax=Zoarces viviparus TaxID=48416 RepID=A0AAW1EZF2_ZOAVI